MAMLGRGLFTRQLRPVAFPNHGRRLLATTAARHADFTHAVIGGGVVGLAIARELAGRDANTVLLERHAAVGAETSSRNSEVIHAGIYYGADSLKTKLCIAGKQQLYELCERHDVPHRRTGKWIVAQNEVQREALEAIHEFCSRPDVDVPVRWVGADEARRREPEVRAERGVLESLSTGIVDSHALMLCLLGLFEDAGGVLALGSAVDGIEPLGGDHGSEAPGSGGWKLIIRDVSTGETSTMTAETIINSAGLGAVAINNMIVPKSRHKMMYYAKGNYFSYTPSHPKVKMLIYPAPEPGHGGLGTHLTVDIAGRIRFGPDVEWVDSPDDLAVNAARLDQAITEIKRYLPGIDDKGLAPDYAGIRPKLGRASAVAQGKGFQDFIIRKEDGYQGWINLLGIESPGLTSSMAIGRMVRDLLYR